jgi:hypothetical protein
LLSQKAKSAKSQHIEAFSHNITALTHLPAQLLDATAHKQFGKSADFRLLLEV